MFIYRFVCEHEFSFLLGKHAGVGSIQDSERGACAGEEEKVGGTYQGWNGNFSGIILLGLQGRREQEGYWP